MKASGEAAEDRTTKIFVESCSSLHELHDLLPQPVPTKPSTATSLLHVHDVSVSVLKQSSTAQSILSSSPSDISGCCRQSTFVGSEAPASNRQAVLPTCSSLSILETLQCQWMPLLLPAAILVIAIIVTVTVASPSMLVIYYLIAYALTFAASALWLSLCHAVQTTQLLSGIVDHVPEALTRTAGAPFSNDARVRYVQTRISNDVLPKLQVKEKHIKPEDPLAFIREVIAFKALDLKNGHCIVDLVGTILWCNEALTTYFGWEAGGLVGENVRVLMPAPYRDKHDTLMRNHDRAVKSKIIGNRRRVPVVDRLGVQSTALLGVEEYTDPESIDNCVFLASMTFPDGSAHPDPAATVQQRLDEGEKDMWRCCASLATHPDGIVVINAQGIIEWVNDSATLTLLYGFEELIGKNVKCLMADEHARQHDGFLASYQERSLASFLGAGRFESAVVGRSRDVHAKTKSGEFIRVFLTVKRVDQPSRLTRDCHFVGTLLVVQKSQEEAAMLRSQSMRTFRSTASLSLSRVGTLSSLATRKCSLVALELVNIDQWDFHFLHRDLTVFYNIAASLAARFKGVLHQPVGDRLHISFNVLSLNNAHRSNAGNLLHTACQQWRFNKQQSRARLLAAGVSGSCVVGQFMTSGVMLSQLQDMCTIFLRIACTMGQEYPIMDSALYDDLQYAFICRPVNVLSVLDVRGKPLSPETLYELQFLKAADEDEWMYQIAQSERRDTLVHWRHCWELVATCSWPDYTKALDHLARHLEEQPEDVVGWWLRDTLRARQAGKAVLVQQESGKLRYMLRFWAGNTPTEPRTQG
eukprot:GGOE01047473.1.p1 GENE.GGOE01047473.1~~GGOE01047473.1.p1  ORF type:complete len:810 (+),score=180.23 GGOE01047473.1:41-2470(+)